MADVTNNFMNKFNGAMGMGVGAGLGDLFSPWSNPSDSAQGPLNQIPGTMKPYYDPYISAGKSGLDQSMGQYGQLTNDPGGMYNKLAGGYQQSPGFQFALQQALQGAAHASAAGGMAGTPMDQQQQMGLATNLANQDFGNYMSRVTGLYDTGLGGLEGNAQRGYQASDSLAQSLANQLMMQSALKYQGQNSQNQHEGGAFGSILGGLGGLAGNGAFSGLF